MRFTQQEVYCIATLANKKKQEDYIIQNIRKNIYIIPKDKF